MLNLLLRQPYTKEDIRTDFINYCQMRLTDPKSPYAVRVQCIKLAYEQMKYWPEQLNELRQTLECINKRIVCINIQLVWYVNTR